MDSTPRKQHHIPDVASGRINSSNQPLSLLIPDISPAQLNNTDNSASQKISVRDTVPNPLQTVDPSSIINSNSTQQDILTSSTSNELLQPQNTRKPTRKHLSVSCNNSNSFSAQSHYNLRPRNTVI